MPLYDYKCHACEIIEEHFAGVEEKIKPCKCGGEQKRIFTSNYYINPDIDYVTDILKFNPKDVPFVPHIIWASPPCTGFSVASIGRHWGGGKGAYVPKSDTARLGIRIVGRTLEIIEYYKRLNPNLIWYIENPRGVLRKMPFMQDFKRHTVTYCQYGDDRMKPTDIWTNDETWTPRPICKNGAPCHVSAPRGSKTGTQGLRGAYERSVIPEELFKEIL